MLGWFGDLGRLAWGLVYWNGRKSLFRLRGSSGAAPCQHPSDSGLAHKTGCEACLHWNGKTRFHRLCPLVEFGADRRPLCSVNAADVRPFWGRAGAFYGGSVAMVWLSCLLVAFAGFRAIGYNVPMRVLAWPPSWRQVNQARADYFYRMALVSYKAGDIRKCILALAQVYQLDPGNYDAARLFAQFLQLGEPDVSDRIYSRLIRDYPVRRDETAQVWFRSLLLRGDFTSLEALSARMIRTNPPQVSAWIEGLLFAEGQLGTDKESRALMARPGDISEEAAAVLRVALVDPSDTPQVRLERLAALARTAATPYELYFSIKHLVEWGHPEEALKILNRQTQLSERDQWSLRLSAYAALGWQSLERGEIQLVLGHAPSASAVNAVAADLIAHPDPDTAEATFRILDEHPLPSTSESLSAHSALLCVAGVLRDWSRFGREANQIASLVGRHTASEQRARAFFESKSPQNPSSFLPAMDLLSVEVIYSLLDRYPPSHRVPAKGSED